MPTAVCWNVGDPTYADKIVRDESIDVLRLSRPTIANPHWPLFTALALGDNAPHDVLPKQYGHGLQPSRDTVNCNGFGQISEPIRTRHMRDRVPHPFA